MDKTLDIIFDLIKEPNEIVWSIFIFILSFVITYKMIPIIFETVNYKNLMDNPNERSSHVFNTPTLGGRKASWFVWQAAHDQDDVL